MKTKKLALPIIILMLAVVAMAVFGIVTNIAKKPTITEHEFPFSITYELNGKTETIEGVYVASYVGNGGYTKVTTRRYEGEFISNREDMDTSIVISDWDHAKEGSIDLYTRFYPDYLMGDPEYQYFTDYAYEPLLIYSDPDYAVYEDAETVLQHGARLISWEYPEPIENSFVFSHIGHFSSHVVLPFAVIALLALLAMILFVKKEQDLPKSGINVLSVILNFVIAFTAVPFVTVVGWISDINGSSDALLHQLLYVMPALMILGLAASVALRRKDFGKGSLIAQLAAPGAYAIMLVLMFFFE